MSIDKLALTCKVLMDERVLELRKEVEGLKLSLYWERHSIYVFEKAMTWCNSNEDISCECESCIRTKIDFPSIHSLFFEQGLERFDGDCKFQDYFLCLMEKLGISFHSWDKSARAYLNNENPSVTSGEYPIVFYDSDCHLIMDMEYCKIMGFGKKLEQCKSEEDP